MHDCRHCGQQVADRFRYCPWCATPQRVKVVEFFPPHADVAADRAKGLRVSRYFGDADTPPQVRFSIWSRESAAAAISLDEDEAVRLAAFVAPVRVRKPLLEQLRDSLRI